MKIQPLIGKFKKLIILVLVWVSLLLWLSLTDPRKLPIVLLMVPFVLLFAAIFLTVSLVISRFIPKVSSVKRRTVASSVAGLPCFLLVLSSVNQLTWRDVALIAFLSIFLLFYASRARFSN